MKRREVVGGLSCPRGVKAREIGRFGFGMTRAAKLIVLFRLADDEETARHDYHAEDDDSREHAPIE